MLVIRLARGGRTKYPTYRIVAAESARAATGKYVEVLGHYNPHTKELVIKKEETQKRLSNGAQPSNTVIKLLQREGMELPAWAKLKTKQPKPKAEEAPVGAPATDEPSEEEVTADEAPADSATPKKASDDTAAPAEDEVRVAEAATANAATTEDKATPAGKTETAEDTAAAADSAEKAEMAGAEAALATPDESAEKADQA